MSNPNAIPATARLGNMNIVSITVGRSSYDTVLLTVEDIIAPMWPHKDPLVLSFDCASVETQAFLRKHFPETPVTWR